MSGVAPAELEAWLNERGEPAYRARQVADAAWGGNATSAADARTLPAALRDALDDADAAVRRRAAEALLRVYGLDVADYQEAIQRLESPEPAVHRAAANDLRSRI